MIFYIAETDWLDIFTKITMTVMGCAMLTLGGVAYYKVVVKGNGKPEKSELMQLIQLIKLQVESKTGSNGQGSCPNTEAIQKIETVTLRDNTPIQMVQRNIKDSKRIKNAEHAGCVTAHATVGLAKMMHKQQHNGKSGEWGEIELPKVIED